MSFINRKNNIFRFASILLFVLSFLVFSNTVFAVEYGGFGGRPAYPRIDNPRTESIFIHTLNPGDVKDEGVIVVNNSQESKDILVYAVDSTPSTGGAFACEQLSQGKDDVGKWISMSKESLTLKAGEKEIVPFTISVPINAGVGEHNGCIIIQEKKVNQGDASGVSLSFRTGLRVAVTIPGDLERKLEISGFTIEEKDNGNFLLQPKVKNLGNVSVDADVEVTTKYFFGLTHHINGGQYPILRGDVSDWNFELEKPFWGGWYKTHFTVSYDENKEASVGVNSGKDLTYINSGTLWFFSTPTAKGLIFEIVILLLIITICYLYIRRKDKWKKVKNTWVMYEVKDGEDLNKLSDMFGVPWKFMAKVNKISPPYVIKAGDKIKVPPRE